MDGVVRLIAWIVLCILWTAFVALCVQLYRSLWRAARQRELSRLACLDMINCLCLPFTGALRRPRVARITSLDVRGPQIDFTRWLTLQTPATSSLAAKEPVFLFSESPDGSLQLARQI